MPEPAITFVLVCLAMALGGAVQGATGFGSGLVTVGLLGGLIGARDASIAVTLPGLAVVGMLLWPLRRHFRWSGVLPIFCAVVVAVPFGVLFLAHAPRRALEIVLGAVMLASAAYNLHPRLSPRRWHPLWLGVPCGLLGGAIGGAPVSYTHLTLPTTPYV